MDYFIEVLRKFSLEDALKLEEIDEQYLALKDLYYNIKDPELFIKLSITNSLLSFQLIYTGEKFWRIFSDYFSNKRNINLCLDFIDFIEKYNPRFKEIKIKRLNKICSWIDNVNLLDYKNDLKKFNIDLAKFMNQKEDDKTIVFSVKIYGYCLRILGYKIIFPFDIFIPIDNRIGKISKDKKFWWDLSKKLNIPLLHLDSIIWISYGIDENKLKGLNGDLREKVIELKNLLKNIINGSSSRR